jgi:hypothetical protein
MPNVTTGRPSNKPAWLRKLLSFFFLFQKHHPNTQEQQPPPQWTPHVTTIWKNCTLQGQTTGDTIGLTPITRLPPATQKPGKQAAMTKDVGTGTVVMNATIPLHHF